MKITKEIVQKTAHLARLTFDAQGEAQMMEDLQKMVDWVDKLKELDTEGVEPLTGMSMEKNAFREDHVSGHISREQALKNAPQHDSEHFRVPKVIN